MPTVTVQYQLPEDREALEHSLLGAESLSTLKSIGRFVALRLAQDGYSDDYRRALSDIQSELHQLGVGGSHADIDEPDTLSNAERAEAADVERELSRERREPWPFPAR